MKSHRNCLSTILSLAVLAATALGREKIVDAQTAGVDIKVTIDNNNVDGGDATPSFDAKNLPQGETSVAISPVNPNIIVIAANDARFSYFLPGLWIELYVSSDGGTTWFNTMIPGFFTDTSTAGVSSLLHQSMHAADPTVRFDANGNLFISALVQWYPIDLQPLGPLHKAGIYLVKYDYSPGSAGGVSTTASAANPPNFTYSKTTRVDNATRFVLPYRNAPSNPAAGQVDDKPWLAIDNDQSSGGFGNIYAAFTIIEGSIFNGGNYRTVFTRSTDGGESFEAPQFVSEPGAVDSGVSIAANIAIAKSGRVYLSYRTFGAPSQLFVLRSDDFGRHFAKPVPAASFEDNLGALGWLAADDTNPDVVYAAFNGLAGSPANSDIFVTRSADGGVTWSAPARVNDDTASKHQLQPTITVSNGVLHVAWLDMRQSTNPGDPSLMDVENVYYAASNLPGFAFPHFTPNLRVSDVGSNPTCLGFYGRDYLEMAARFDGTKHTVHVAWSDSRDIPPSKCGTPQVPPGDAGPLLDDFTGKFNSNVFKDRIVVP